MEFGDKLKKLRAEKGISQKVLADSIFVSRSAVAKWENGLGLPSDESFEALVNYFGVPKEFFKTEQPETIILEKNRKIRWRTIFTNIIAAVLIAIILCSNYIANRESRELQRALDEYDVRMAMEFDAAKEQLCLEFQKHEYSARMSREMDNLKMASLYGGYFNDFSGGDAQWRTLAGAICELNNAEIFTYLSAADCDMIAKFLEEHEYRNSPEITEEDIAPILERIDTAVQGYVNSP